MENNNNIKNIYRTACQYLSEDIEIALVYGSTVYGMSDEYSDLDFAYIPASPHGKKLAETFLLNGIGYDIWEISWDTLDNIANLIDYRPSILLDNEVLFAQDHAKLRLENLKEKTKRNLSIEPNQTALKEKFNEASMYYGQFALSGYKDMFSAGKLIYALLECWNRLNRTYLKYGIRRLPDEFNKIFDGDFNVNVSIILKEIKSKIFLEEHEYGPGLYEEIASSWNKIRRFSREHDKTGALLAAASLQEDVGYKYDIFQGWDGSNLEDLVQQANKAETAFKNDAGKLLEYHSLTELKDAIFKRIEK